MPAVYSLNSNISDNNNKIKQKIIFSGRHLYNILNYDKHFICFNDDKHKLYRSVIFAYPEKEVLAFSPPKSMNFSVFKHKYHLIDNNILINELVEGIMVHLFYDHRIQRWEIATKRSIYYLNIKHDNSPEPNMTFYRMFLDAVCATPGQELKDIIMFDMFPKNMSYTFILQHPANKILIPVNRPTIYLISVYAIRGCNGTLDGTCVEYIPATEYESWKEFQNINGIIEFPKQFNNIVSYDDFTGNTATGFVMSNIQTGEHTVLKCSKYTELMKTKTILPNLQYSYLCLRRINKIEDYLLHFPQYKKQFFLIREDYNKLVANVHQYYMNYYVLKNTKYIDNKYYTYIVKIHKTIYLHALNNKKHIRINRKIVCEYFDNMEPRELLYILNCDHRELMYMAE